MTRTPRTLLLAWGNPGRLDDGLGPALADAIAGMAIPGVDTEIDYQLQIEHAEQASQFERVLFADAAREGPEPFSISPLLPERSGVRFSSHSVSPGSVLALAHDLFGAEPEAWLIGIRGYEFDDFGERLSQRALTNLTAATLRIGTALATGRLDEIASRHPGSRRLDEREKDPCQTASR